MAESVIGRRLARCWLAVVVIAGSAAACPVTPRAAPSKAAHDETCSRALAALDAFLAAPSRETSGRADLALDTLSGARCDGAATRAVRAAEVTGVDWGAGILTALEKQRDGAACTWISSRAASELSNPPDGDHRSSSRFLLPALAASCGGEIKPILDAEWTKCLHAREDEHDVGGSASPFECYSVLRALALLADVSVMDDDFRIVDDDVGLIARKCQFAEIVRCYADRVGEAEVLRLTRPLYDELPEVAEGAIRGTFPGCDGEPVTCPLEAADR